MLDALYSLTDRGDPLLVGLWAGQLWKSRGEAEGAYGGYLVAVRRVNEAVRESNELRQGPPYRIGAEIRCALIRSSIRSLTDYLPEESVVALVDAGIWTIDRAVRVAGDFARPYERSQALWLLAGRASDQAREQSVCLAVAAARCISDKRSSADLLISMAQTAGEARQDVLSEALAARYVALPTKGPARRRSRRWRGTWAGSRSCWPRCWWRHRVSDMESTAPARSVPWRNS